MNFRHFVAGAAAVAALGVFAPLQSVAADTPPAAAVTPTAAMIAHGEYLTHGAGQCMDCHGVGLVGKPKFSPSLVGLKMFANDADAVTFLMTAHLPGGGQAMEPMPKYNFSRSDAESIVAYLRSLK